MPTVILDTDFLSSFLKRRTETSERRGAPTPLGRDLLPAIWAGLAIALLFCLAVAPPRALAQGREPIRVLSSETENHFPDGLTFHLHADADQPLVRIDVYYRTQGGGSTARQPVEFEPGKEVVASYTWDTSRTTVVPSSPVTFYWKLQDQAGNQLTTPEQTVYYDDLRFSWREISDPDLIVRWYEGDEDFGRFAYQTARRALDQMVEQSGQELAYPVFVLLYANDEDFGSWHSYVDEWVGGQAFPRLGVTTQIVPPDSRPAWIEDVLPHEVAHLFFYQALKGALSSWPAWLDEGLAQYYEFGSPDPALERAARAARRDKLLPLASLSGGFGRDPEQVQLSYDQSLSVVTYLLETWGDEGLQRLLDAFRQNKSSRLAVQETLGVTWEEFEAGWITWMGVPTTPAAPPTPTATLVRPPEPAGWPTPTRRAPAATQTPAADATQPSPVPSLTPSPVRGAPTAIPASQPTPTRAKRATRGPICLPCSGATLAPLLVAGVTLLLRPKT